MCSNLFTRCQDVIMYSSSTGRLWHLEKNISTRPMYCKLDVVLVVLIGGCKFSSAKLGIFEGFALKSIQNRSEILNVRACHIFCSSDLKRVAIAALGKVKYRDEPEALLGFRINTRSCEKYGGNRRIIMGS